MTILKATTLLFSLTLLFASTGTASAETEAGGTVIDVTTGLPVEGAYVMNVYSEAGSSFMAHSASWCVSTKGMVTGKDGKFHFPLRKSKYLSPEVIKVGYAQTKAPSVKWKRTLTGIEQVPDPNIYLKPQDPAKPEYSTFVHCERAYWKRDVAGLLEYYKVQLAELEAYGDRNGHMKFLEGQIRQLEARTD